MNTLLKKFFIIALVACIPTLAAAAGTAPAAGVSPSPVAETTPNKPVPVIAESKPSPPPVARQSAKIGYVDVQRILKESMLGKKIETKLKALRDKLLGQVEIKRKQLEKQRAMLEAKLPTLSPEQKKSKAKSFQKSVDEFQKYAKKLEEELYTSQGSESRGLSDETEQVAAIYGKANNYAAIVVKKELLYVGDTVDAQDVTDMLIKALDEETLKK